MSSNNMNLWVTLGAGVASVVVIAGTMLYEYLKQDNRMKISRDVSRLNRQVVVLQEEIETLQRLQKQNAAKKRVRSRNNASSTTGTESDAYMSAVGTDIDSDDEFYDLSSDEGQPEEAGDDIQKILDETDKQMEKGDSFSINKAQISLKNLLKKNPHENRILWRLAKICHLLSECTEDLESKQQLFEKGLDYCRIAFCNNDNDAQAHKWYAVLIGNRAKIQSSTKDKISDGHEFKRHIEKSLGLDSSDASLHHMLGRFYFEVSGLSWLERTAAATLFGEPPQGTFTEAMECFKKAEKLSKKEWKENRLFIAKCFIQESDYESAFVWLEKAKKIPALTDMEIETDTEIQMLINKYNGYR